MEQHLSSSKVTVEYFDPHDVYKLLAPGLIPRLPLRHLHWQSHAGPLRSIDTLHLQLVAAGTSVEPASSSSVRSASSAAAHRPPSREHHGLPAPHPSAGDVSLGASEGGSAGAASSTTPDAGRGRRHQIPGLRPTPYLKVLLVRCDSSDIYKSKARAEIRHWIKKNTPPPSSSRKASNQENHDAFEWLIVHVVIPNTAAAMQPRTLHTAESSTASDKTTATTGARSLFGGPSATLLDKMRSDFNGSGKNAVDRVAQVRIGVNDVPYDLLPRVVPAVPTGYVETARDVQAAWEDMIAKFKDLILSSFDSRVTQYEEDIREKDAQRSLPGWNFCTFFMLKEGLARGFESVGLVEDALVMYDQLSVGLDSVVQEPARTGAPGQSGGALLGWTEELKDKAEKAAREATEDAHDDTPEVRTDDADTNGPKDPDEIIISSTRKPYRELILANNVSLFDFRCYLFARQVALLLRLANAWSSREELLAKLKEEQDSISHGVAPRAVPKKQADESENLQVLAEICRRALQFIPAISEIMRSDVVAALVEGGRIEAAAAALEPRLAGVIDNIVSSFAFSVSQQILAQTSTKALPIPPSSLAPPDGHEPKSSSAIPEPKTVMHPARSSSLRIDPSATASRPPPSPSYFPGPGRRASFPESEARSQFIRTGLEDLATRRAELYRLSRNILQEAAKKRGWNDGWQDAPVVGADDVAGMEEISLDDDAPTAVVGAVLDAPVGIDDGLLRAALGTRDDFYKLYEILTDKSLRHSTVAQNTHWVQACMTDLGVLKFHVGEWAAAASFFYRATPFFGETGWALPELSMLVMYARCLEELGRKDDYVKVAQKILSKAALAEKERLLSRGGGGVVRDDFSAVRGILGKLYDATKELGSQVYVPLADFFTNVDVDGAPEYHERRDGFSLCVKLHSLLVDDLAMESAVLHMTCLDGGPGKELKLETSEGLVIRPGKNTLRLTSNVIAPGRYRVDKLDILSANLALHFDRNVSPGNGGIFRRPDMRVIQRTGGLDVRLAVGKHLQLGTNKPLRLDISSGWNDISSCVVRVKPATGGLRLLTTEAVFVDDKGHEFAKPPEAGQLSLGAIPAQSSASLQFPFSLEQDLSRISVRVEVTFSAAGETFTHSKTAVVPVALALRVNVQDVFRHAWLLSRFNVMTATASPLRLLDTSLQGCDAFEPESSGAPPPGPVTVYPREPACLLYKIRRRTDADAPRLAPATRLAQTTMFLKLRYSVVQTEIEDQLRVSISSGLNDAPGLEAYADLIADEVVAEFAARVTPADLERATMLNEISTAFMTSIDWPTRFHNLGNVPNTSDTLATRIPAFLSAWTLAHPTLPMPPPSSTEPSSVLIPVCIPSIATVHTTDIHLTTPTPTLTCNALVGAMLSLKWSRLWDTSTTGPQDREFSYDVVAAPDTWLVAGRRRGHFIIPADADILSGEATEAAIPLVLMPLREGLLSWPGVEIREVNSSNEGGESGGGGTGDCEVDWKNLGEVVRVVGGRRGVTVSLDASGPGGGPLVLDVRGPG